MSSSKEKPDPPDHLSDGYDSLDEFSPESRKKYHEKYNQGYNQSKLKPDKPLPTKFDFENITANKFYSDNEINNFVREYQSVSNSNYYQRDLQSKSNLTNLSRKSKNNNLKNRFIKFLCIHSSPKHPPKPLGGKDRKT